MEKIESKRPLIIAGPCSAESKEQTVNTALALAKTGKVDIFRAGIWKPRTKPNTFAGMGAEALPWLSEAKRLSGLPVATEVATAQHIEEAAAHDIDVFWVGARTTSNPFSMQEVAESLRGTDKLVFVKNPINSDIELWLGAIERLAQCNVKRIALIHRGFSSYRATILRNAPMWHLALEMRRRAPELPMICDPSHICGRRDLIGDIAQQAADLNYDGLMIESHISPEHAKSDAGQQLTPNALNTLLNEIKWRLAESDSAEFNVAIEELRRRIDHIDGEIFQLLVERMNASEEIGYIKRDNNVMILQSARWDSIVNRTLSLHKESGLSEEFLRTILDAIHIESINRQNRVMKGE